MFEIVDDGLIVTDLETGRVLDANPAAAAMHGWTPAEFVGQPVAAYRLAPDDPRALAARAESRWAGGEAETLVVHTRQDHSAFYVEAHRTLFTYRGRACQLSALRDVSQRVGAERLLRQKVETHAREQAVLLEVSQTLASALELQPGLILDQLRVILDYTQAGLFSMEDWDLVSLATRGPDDLERAGPFRIRLNSPGTLPKLFDHDRPVRIADVSSADPAARLLRALLDGPAAALLSGVSSWMWVPVIVKDRVIGSLGIGHHQPDYFTAHHADLAHTVANLAAITLVKAELIEHAQVLAVLQERQRLAQELHDAVNQSLFSAGLIAEVLPRLWERDPSAGRRSLEDLRRLTRGALAEMRMLLVELRPSALTDSELGDLLRLLGNALTGRTNIPVVVSVAGQGVLPANVQVVFYRLCQEGLNNIARHAAATRVEIQLQYLPEGGVELRVRDDGRGFDPASISPGHFGLSMMRERAESVGAVLTIASQPRQGADLCLRWADALELEPK